MLNYKQLDTWQEAMNLVQNVFTITKTYPKSELYGLTSQTRRAAVSVPSNVAEGCGRQFKKESIQFFHIARGSLYELETLITIGQITHLAEESECKAIQDRLQKCLQLVNGLVRHYEKADLK